MVIVVGFDALGAQGFEAGRGGTEVGAELGLVLVAGDLRGVGGEAGVHHGT